VARLGWLRRLAGRAGGFGRDLMRRTGVVRRLWGVLEPGPWRARGRRCSGGGLARVGIGSQAAVNAGVQAGGVAEVAGWRVRVRGRAAVRAAAWPVPTCMLPRLCDSVSGFVSLCLQ
jgi:hypothetical protein